MKYLRGILLVIVLALMVVGTGCGIPVYDSQAVLFGSSNTPYSWIGNKTLTHIDSSTYTGYWRQSNSTGEYQMAAKRLKFTDGGKIRLDEPWGQYYYALYDQAMPLEVVIPNSQVSSIK